MPRTGAHYDKNSIEFLWNLSNTEKNPEIQCHACVSVGYCPVNKLDTYMVKSFNVKQQDLIYFFAGFSFNPDIGDRFYNFFKDNHQSIYDMFGSLAFSLPETFEYAAGSFIDPANDDD